VLNECGGLGAHLPSKLLLAFVPADASDKETYEKADKQHIYAVDAQVAMAGSHTWKRLAVSAKKWPLQRSGTTGNIGWTYCPINGCFYAVDGKHDSRSIWKLSPPQGALTTEDFLVGTWTIEEESLTASISNYDQGGAPTGTSSIYNRLVWDDCARCFLWVDDWYESQVQAIRPRSIG
jgi:hypothetical protein